MKKSLLPVLLLVALPFAALAMGGSGMNAKQQDKCRKACMMRGDKWDPTSAANREGCTCISGEGDNYVITDADMGQRNLDNEVGKTAR